MNDEAEGVENQVHYTRASLLINSTYTFVCKFLLVFSLDPPVHPHSQSHLKNFDR